MKKMLVLAVVVALAIPAMAWSASPYVSSIKDGKYEGTINSKNPDLNGQKVVMEVKHEGDVAVSTVTYKDAKGADNKEVWRIGEKNLDQQEFDAKTGKSGDKYGATATVAATPNAQTFFINCKDKVKNDCDAGADARLNWTIKTGPDTVNYIVSGVTKDKKGDPTAKPEQRHDFAFKRLN